MKKKTGPSAGIPRPSGERSSPGVNGGAGKDVSQTMASNSRDCLHFISRPFILPSPSCLFRSLCCRTEAHAWPKTLLLANHPAPPPDRYPFLFLALVSILVVLLHSPSTWVRHRQLPICPVGVGVWLECPAFGSIHPTFCFGLSTTPKSRKVRWSSGARRPPNARIL